MVINIILLVSNKLSRNNNVANTNKFKLNTSKTDTECCPQEKLLKLKSDDQLNFKRHMSHLCKRIVENECFCTHIFLYRYI